MSDTLHTFWERLESFMRTGETQREFAERIGVAQTQISYWRLGKQIGPRRDVAERIASALSINPAWLLYGTGEMRAEPDDVNHNTARRLANKTSKTLTDGDLMAVASGYILDLQNVPRDDRQAMADCLKRAAEDPEFRDKILAYQRFLEAEAKRKK